MRRFVILLAVLALATVLVSAPSMAAGKGKPAPDSSAVFELSVLSGTDQVPNWAEQITFNVHTSATSEPHVDLTCSQGGAVVFGATTGFYDSYPWPWTQVMTLASQDWSGGAADCTARLYYFDGRKSPTLKTLSIHVAG